MSNKRVLKLDERDLELIAQASRTLECSYQERRHTVASALLTSSGAIFRGVNVDSSSVFGACAETIAIGAARSVENNPIERIVAVGGHCRPHRVLSPCGNCRQLLLNYAPECWVIIEANGEKGKVQAKDLVPYPYKKA